MRVCLFTEELHAPFDEGYKNFIYSLFREAAARHEVLRLGSGDPSVIDTQIHADKLLLNGNLRKAIRDFRPDVVVYVPAASITPASFVRAKILKSHGRGAGVVMVGLQPRQLKPMLRIIAPDAVYVQSEAGKKALESAGFKAGVIRAGVDADKFKPLGASEKTELRAKYGIDQSAFVVVHVGHINEGRNIRVMADIAALKGVQTVVVGSTSTPQDSSLAEELADNGVVVLRGYIEHIEEVYQLADAYVFPVMQSTSAIELPLSVLEAMACDLPVVTTRFGGLADCFREGEGLFFANDAGELTRKLELARNIGEVRTREKIEPFTWTGVFDQFFSEIEQLICQGM